MNWCWLKGGHNWKLEKTTFKYIRYIKINSYFDPFIKTIGNEKDYDFAIDIHNFVCDRCGKTKQKELQ